MKSRLVSFFFQETDSLPAVPARIALGLSLFSHYLLSTSEMGPIYGTRGLSYYVLGLSWPGGVDPTSWIQGLALASAALFTVGFHTRLSGFVLAACHQYFFCAGALFNWGWASLIQAFVIYATLANCGSRFSVDAWLARRSGRPLSTTTPIWPIRLMQIHVCSIYLGAGLHRVNDRGWLEGDMLLHALDVDLFSRFPLFDFFPFRYVLKPLTWGSLLLEVAAPIALWSKRFGRYVAVALFVLHLILELTSTTGRWQTMLMGALFVFILPVKPTPEPLRASATAAW